MKLHALSGEGAPHFPPTAAMDTTAQRQAFVADNMVLGLSRYINDMQPDVQLRSHQYPALRALRDIVSETRTQPEERRILWPAPPNAGKTTLSALIANAAGIGKAAPDGRLLKGVLLVSRSNARHAALETYARLAPNVHMLPFIPGHGADAIDKADMLAMTYAALNMLDPDEQDYIASQTDLLTLDEVHRATGAGISSIINRLTDRYKPTMIGLSATPEFSPQHSAEKILDIKYTLPPMSPREAAQAGVANGVHLLAVHTGSVLFLKTKRINQSEISPLADDADRNNLIVDIAANMANLGHQGLTQGVPGIPASGSRHIEQLAELAEKRLIVDPKTGLQRYLRLEAVGNHRKDSNRVIKAFRNGELDGLLFTRLLTESLDHPMGYLTAASPTGSKVEMGQFVGRGARFYEALTRIFWLCDMLGTSAVHSLVTPFTIFGAATSGQLEVIGRPQAAARTRPVRTAGQQNRETESSDETDKKTTEPQSVSSETYGGLDEALVAAIRKIPPGTFLGEMLVSKGTYLTAPDGYTELVGHPTIRDRRITPGAAAYHLRGRLGQNGLPLMLTVHGQKNTRVCISPEAGLLLNELFVFDTMISRTDMQTFLDEQGWPTMSSDGFLSIGNAVDAPFKVIKGELRFEPEVMHSLLREIASVPIPNPDTEVLVADLASFLGGTTSSAILSIINRSQGAQRFKEYLIDRRRGRQPGAYQVVKAMTVEGAIEYVTDRFTKSPKVRALHGNRTPAEVVSIVQENYRLYMRENGLNSNLSLEAIEEFIAVMLGPDGWTRRMACKKPEVDETWFIDEVGTLARRALQVCGRCAVKSACLADALEHDARGIAGGLNYNQRQELHRPSTD